MRNDRGILLNRAYVFDAPLADQFCYEYDCAVCFGKRSLSEARRAAIITVWAYLHSVTIIEPV